MMFSPAYPPKCNLNPWTFDLLCSYFLWIETSPPRRRKIFREALDLGCSGSSESYKIHETLWWGCASNRWGEEALQRSCLQAELEVPEMPLLVTKCDRMGFSVKELPRSLSPISDTSPKLYHLTLIILLVYQIDPGGILSLAHWTPFGMNRHLSFHISLGKATQLSNVYVRGFGQ